MSSLERCDAGNSIPFCRLEEELSQEEGAQQRREELPIQRTETITARFLEEPYIPWAKAQYGAAAPSDDWVEKYAASFLGKQVCWLAYPYPTAEDCDCLYGFRSVHFIDEATAYRTKEALIEFLAREALKQTKKVYSVAQQSEMPLYGAHFFQVAKEGIPMVVRMLQAQFSDMAIPTLAMVRTRK